MTGLTLAPPSQATNGNYLRGIGPVNTAMGGAGSGLFVEPLGGLKWNAASSVILDPALSVSAEGLFPDLTIASSVEADTFGAGFPSEDLSGISDNVGADAYTVAFGMTRTLAGGRRAWHLGLFGAAGFSEKFREVPFEGADTNFIFTPQPPDGLGFGQVATEYGFFRAPIGMSFQVTDRVALGFSAVPAFAELRYDPMVAAPNDANGDGFTTYPAHADSEFALGFGVDLGLYVEVSERVSFGLAIISPTWFQDFEYSGVEDELGESIEATIKLDGAAVVSAGVGIRAGSRWQFAFDVRWIDWSGNDATGDPGFDTTTGRLVGVDWDSTFVFAAGLAAELGPRSVIRAGYNYNENPIDSDVTGINVGSPLILEQQVSVGLSRELTERLDFNGTYYYAFENDVTGPLIAPQTNESVAGTAITSELSLHGLSLGITLGF